MTTTAPDDPPPALLLGPVLGTLPAHLFQREVLRRLGPTDLASLATALMQWAEHVKRSPPGHLGSRLPPLCLKEACALAACGGNEEALEWLHNTGCPWDTRTCAFAAEGGHLAIVQMARKHGCPWDMWTTAYAALFGHLHVLRWTREHHCPWNWVTPAFAAQGGHLEVLQWARKHGCPWTSSTSRCAAANGHLEVLQWVRENDPTGEVWDENTVRRYAGGPRQQEVLTWLDELSAP